MDNVVKIKERSYIFDTLRGLLIWSIPLSHFTRVGGEFSQGSLSGVIYIIINVFVMQAFMFLSGFFSKKPDRARESAFKTFLLPYVVWTVIFYFFRYAYFGGANLSFLTPPFALWFLFTVFWYRFLLKDLVRIKFLLPLSIILYIFAGQISFLDDFLALGRTVSYFPFFLLGYYCTTEHVKKIQVLKVWQSVILGVILTGIACILAFCVKIPVGFYLLKTTSDILKIEWYVDALARIMVLGLAIGWTILMLNILPKTKNYLTYVGMNTMPIYMLHIFVRYIVATYGVPSNNWIVYYVSIFGLASICVLVFASKPIVKIYDGFMDLCYKIMLRPFEILYRKIFPKKELLK